MASGYMHHQWKQDEYDGMPSSEGVSGVRTVHIAAIEGIIWEEL